MPLLYVIIIRSISTSMESINNDIKKILADNDIQNYFTINKISLYSFIKRYISVDSLLNSPEFSKENIQEQFNQLKLVIHQQNEQINTLSNYVKESYTTIPQSIKDITNSDIRTMISEQLANLQLHLQHQSNPNTLRECLQNFQDKIVNINSEQLNDIDRRSLHMMSNFQSNLLKDISTTLDSHTIHHKITSINDTLMSLHNNFTGNSSQKGKMTENVLYQSLLKAFPDSDVILTRDQPDSCDIHIMKETKPLILIDSKHCEASNVRKSDLDKFYDDCKINDSCGILCNTFGGIANRKHFEIDIQDKRVLVFISNHQFDPVVFQLAVRIIYNIHAIIQDKKTDVIQIDNQLYQRLKIEYNFFLQSFHQHLDNIRANINALSQLSFSQLDHFFKRTTLNSELKPFSCHLCGTGCGSAKTLKKHLKDKHNIDAPVTRNRGRPKRKSNTDGSENGDENQDDKQSDQNTLDEPIEGAVEGTIEGAIEGAVEGIIEDTIEGAVEGAVEGAIEGTVEGAVEGEVDEKTT